MEADFSDAVKYHYGEFPPAALDTNRLLMPLASASAALARYDVMLSQMHNSEILLQPLRRQEAVVSSRMEGTITTLDEVLRYEADQQEEDDARHPGYRIEAVEVLSYSRALKRAQQHLTDGRPLSSWLIRATHRTLMMFGRGDRLKPGEFKTEQNYLADRAGRKIYFVPVSPEQLESHMEALLHYVTDPRDHPLIRTAISHVEFEALHPFQDGNGRLGRMLITLFLWQFSQISAPHFYVSAFFEQNRDEYIDRMREVSKSGAWTDWVIFFLAGIESQATATCVLIEKIRGLYEKTQEDFRRALSSKDYLAAVDFVFANPVFRNSKFTSETGLQRATAARFTRVLTEAKLLRVLEEGSGRRSTMYIFDPLMNLVRG